MVRFKVAVHVNEKRNKPADQHNRDAETRNAFHRDRVHLQATHHPRGAPRGGGWWHQVPSFHRLADMPQPWQRAMALPLTFTAPYGAGFASE